MAWGWASVLVLLSLAEVAVSFQPATSALSARGGVGLRRIGPQNPCSVRRGPRILSIKCQKNDGPRVSKGFNVLELTGAVIPQGKLVTGVKTGWKLAWTTLMRELAPQSDDGEYVRPSYSFQGEIGTAKFPDESGRYHLYVGKACPWCHRVEMARGIRGLEGYVSQTVVLDRPEQASRGGWVFTAGDKDPVWGAKDLREVYDGAVRGGFRGRCTAPLLVDRRAKALVCNESSDLVRMLNRAGGGVSSGVDLYPEALRGAIDEANGWVYRDINNGVYRCGFSTSQAAYDRAEAGLFAALGRVEGILAEQRFLCGDRFTEADLRLFPTVFRFDSVYHILFRCSRARVRDYPNLLAWLGDVHSLPGVAATCDLDATVESYYSQLFPVNPGGIVAARPSDEALGLVGGGGGRGGGDPFHYHGE